MKNVLAQAVHSVALRTRVTLQLKDMCEVCTGYITALDMCEVCTEAVHSVAL